MLMMLWASPAAAEQIDEPTASEPDVLRLPLQSTLGAGYRWVSADQNQRADEYEYLHSSGVASLNMEWAPLPHRFGLEAYTRNPKDYFGDLDYAYRDIVVFNLISRSLFHNLDHYRFGLDGSVEPGLRFEDRNPGAQYGAESEMNKAFIRFKTPDFPFHIYSEARKVEREGTIQQRFLLGSFGDINKVTQSRAIDWKVEEATLGVNSHLGVVEADYHHTEKRFTAGGEKVLVDPYPSVSGGRAADSYPHNLVPDLRSSSDTVKLHTSYTGRWVAAATYSSGDKKNDDSGAQAHYRSAGGDLTFIPWKDLAMFMKYRHSDRDVNNPGPVSLTGITNIYTYNIRESITSQRDIVSGAVRYNATTRLMIKSEYIFDSIQRNTGPAGSTISPLQIAPTPSGSEPADWGVSQRTTKGTIKFGAIYRVMNNLSVRGDYTHMHVADPAYAIDPDKSDTGRWSVTWRPVPRVIALISHSSVREKRGELGISPLPDSVNLNGGSREAMHDQSLASLTLLAGKRSSLTTSYSYFRNKVGQTMTAITNEAGVLDKAIEPNVPYEDIAHIVSIAFSHALGDGVNVTMDGARSYSRGQFRNSGSVPSTDGIGEFSDMKIVERVYTADIEMQHSKNVSTELRYQHRHYDDKIDDAQDGTVYTVLATVSVKW